MIRRLRLTSGLVMLGYVATHLLNQSLGLFSVELMDRVLEVIFRTWSSPIGGVILYSAFFVHYCLALWALWLRRSLKMPFSEAAQLVLGFSIPFFLIDHVLNTRVADTFYGANYGYYQSLLYHYFVDRSRARRSPVRRAVDRLDPRHDRDVVLAPPQAVVPALAAAALRRGAARTDIGDPRHVRGRPRGDRAVGGPGVGRSDDAGAPATGARRTTQSSNG